MDRRQFLRSALGALGLAGVAPVAALVPEPVFTAGDWERGAAFTGYYSMDLGPAGRDHWVITHVDHEAKSVTVSGADSHDDMLDAAMRIPGWETFWRRYYAGLTPEAYEAGQRTILRVHGLEHAKQTAAEHAFRLAMLYLPNPYRGLGA